MGEGDVVGVEVFGQVGDLEGAVVGERGVFGSGAGGQVLVGELLLGGLKRERGF